MSHFFFVLHLDYKFKTEKGKKAIDATGSPCLDACAGATYDRPDRQMKGRAPFGRVLLWPAGADGPVHHPMAQAKEGKASYDLLFFGNG